MAELWWLMLALGTAAFVLFAVLLLLGLRRRQSDESGLDRETRQLSRHWIVFGGVVQPALLILIVFAATLVAMRVVPTRAPADALVVEVVGHQWWWEVHYPDHGITTANELHIPVGRPIAFELTSADVIHSFWVPELGGKIDLLPDGTNTLVLEAAEPGIYRGNCAEFCGLQHTKMGLLVVAEPAEQFAAWVAEQQRPAIEPAGADARWGRDVFLGAECVNCHTIRGVSTADERGPDLTHVAARQTIGATTLPVTPANLEAWVRDPHAFKQGVAMPAAELAPDELDALVAYLETLQ